ncbi:MAG: porin, partial [Gammaproteobacteria bacterium]
MKHLSLSALAAVGVLAGMTAANAADLGGNCCADLEERIAELEATTVRKGNRKVSLTVSGFVAQQVIAWDDGVKSKAYVADTGSVSIGSNVSFSGKAQISPDVSAGYVLQLELIKDDPLLQGQNSSATTGSLLGGGGGATVLQSFWYLKSEHLGKLSVGLQSSAVDNQAILPDASGSLIQANYVIYDAQGFFNRINGRAVGSTWGSLGSCKTLINAQAAVVADCDGFPNNNVRYDSPTIAGFSGSVSWGESNIWGFSGRYSGETPDFKFNAAVAYVENDDANFNPLISLTGLGGGVGIVAPNGLDASAIQVGAYLQHIPTGLFVYGAYGHDFNDSVGGLNVLGQKQQDGDNYYIKGG